MYIDVQFDYDKRRAKCQVKEAEKFTLDIGEKSCNNDHGLYIDIHNDVYIEISLKKLLYKFELHSRGSQLRMADIYPPQFQYPKFHQYCDSLLTKQERNDFKISKYPERKRASAILKCPLLYANLKASK